MKFKKDFLQGKVLGVYSSVHPDKTYKGRDYFVTEQRDELFLDLEGVIGDRHHGFETISGGRFMTLYERDTPVRNNRQWSVISPKEIAIISKNLGVTLTPELLGVNFLIDGIPELSKLSPMSYLIFSPEESFAPQRPDDVTLVAYGEALPCTIAGMPIADAFSDPSLEHRFPKAANDHRGLTGWVEKGGVIYPGYSVTVLTPTGRD